ncbi:MAG: stage III sporulation protein AE [Lachnospiraceae bacterium]|nr:stage III sporulation protein AE [Lachnospiraceae bacterium]
MKRTVFGLAISFILIGICIWGLKKTVTASQVPEKAESEQQADTYVDDYYDNFLESEQITSLEEELKGINRKYGKETGISFSDIMRYLLEGNVEEAVSYAIQMVCGNISSELLENRMLLVKMIVLIIVAAIFNNYSSVLKSSFVGEQGFYITYLMIAVLLMQSFTLVYGITEETVYYIKEIMECMLPAFYMSIILCSGLTTSQMVNTMFLWMLSLIEKVLLNVVLPGIRIYFLIIVLNQINAKDRFSKLAGLIKQGIQFLLKSIVTGIIGINVMKSILLPVYDNAKYSVLQKGLSAVPGGAAFSGLSTILIGAGVLIKNSVGLAVAAILLVLGSVPLLKIFCFYIIYRVILAMVQPISDRRILAGIQGAADSTGILLRAAMTSIVLSVLSIAIILLTTNVRLYTS